jgi:hypothetical protein
MKNNVVRIPLRVSTEQRKRLQALQQTFAKACNALAPVARDTRCWNRVALHHMMYRSLRDDFPQLGSQMVCNVVYSVSRTCRQVYQAPNSPFNLARLGDNRLPLVMFAPTSPVYFDRHTLSIKDGLLSMYTLDGRMRFQLALSKADEQRFHEKKLLEIILSSVKDAFFLTFVFEAESNASAKAKTGKGEAQDSVAGMDATEGELPPYVRVSPEAAEVNEGNPA